MPHRLELISSDGRRGARSCSRGTEAGVCLAGRQTLQAGHLRDTRTPPESPSLTPIH
jgi:hypothetical protein